MNSKISKKLNKLSKIMKLPKKEVKRLYVNNKLPEILKDANRNN